MEARRGVALALVVALLVALSLLAQGALHLARREATVARAATRSALDRVEGRAALRRAEAAVDSLVGPVGGVDTLPAPGVGWSASVRRLGPESGLLTVQSTRGVGVDLPVRRVAYALVWGLDPVARAGRLRGVALVGGDVTAPPGTISTDRLYGVGSEGRILCAPLEPGLDSLRAAVPPPPPVAPLGAGPPFEPPASAEVALGALAVDSLSARLPVRVAASTVSPAPVLDGARCDRAAADNWGSPTDRFGPCGAHTVARVVDGDLTVDGGEGQGVLVVRGDLVLRGGATFAGAAVVEGSLGVSGASRLEGAVVVGGALTMAPDSRLVGDACVFAAALARRPELRRPVVVAEPLIPLF